MSSRSGICKRGLFEHGNADRGRIGTCAILVSAFVMGTLTACTLHPAPEAGEWVETGKRVHVDCTGGPEQGDAPCLGAAVRNCGGKARLVQILSRTSLPMTQGVEQNPVPWYQYSATYACLAPASH